MENLLTIEVDRIHRFENGGPLRAFVDVILGGQFVIKGFRLVEGKNGLFVGMPSEVGKNGAFYNSVKPITKEAQVELSKAIIQAYQKK